MQQAQYNVDTQVVNTNMPDRLGTHPSAVFGIVLPTRRTDRGGNITGSKTLIHPEAKGGAYAGCDPAIAANQAPVESEQHPSIIINAVRGGRTSVHSVSQVIDTIPAAERYVSPSTSDGVPLPDSESTTGSAENESNPDGWRNWSRLQRQGEFLNTPLTGASDSERGYRHRHTGAIRLKSVDRRPRACSGDDNGYWPGRHCVTNFHRSLRAVSVSCHSKAQGPIPCAKNVLPRSEHPLLRTFSGDVLLPRGSVNDWLKRINNWSGSAESGCAQATPDLQRADAADARTEMHRLPVFSLESKCRAKSAVSMLHSLPPSVGPSDRSKGGGGLARMRTGSAGTLTPSRRPLIVATYHSENPVQVTHACTGELRAT